MRIAFYAPLKPPDHPTPSGDRTMARLLLAALAGAGHEVEIAARFSSRDAEGDAGRQARLAALGGRLATRLLRRCRRAGGAPQLWFTYHLYDRAPDWLGPPVAAALGIPYVVAEASLAPRRAGGRWRAGHAAVAAALGTAAAVVGLNPADRDCVLPHLADPARWHDLPPFIETRPFAAARAGRAAARARLAAAHGLDPALPWIAAVGMMRAGDKLASWRLLGAALTALGERRWQLLAIGDGAAADEVAAALAPLGRRVAFLGRLAPAEVAETLAAADLMAWPAINEAWGMALVEAQAAGLAVVAGAAGGVPAVVADGVTGLLTPPGDVGSFAAALARLVDDAVLRARLGAAALERARTRHDIAPATARLTSILEAAIAIRGPG